MNKDRLLVLLGGLFPLLFFTALFASNMVFQRSILLTGPGSPPVDGTNTISLPYDSPVQSLYDLGIELGGFECQNPANPVVNLQSYNNFINGLAPYDGCFGANPPIVPGDGYRIKVNQDVNYTIVGSHDPEVILDVEGPVSSFDGTNVLAWPPHSKANTANKLGIEAGDFKCRNAGNKVLFVQVYRKASGGIDLYDGCFGTSGGFPLEPGDGYRIKMDDDVSFVPKHY